MKPYTEFPPEPHRPKSTWTKFDVVLGMGMAMVTVATFVSLLLH